METLGVKKIIGRVEPPNPPPANRTLGVSGASTCGGEVDATCFQIGLGGRELHPEGGRIPPDIWVIREK